MVESVEVELLTPDAARAVVEDEEDGLCVSCAVARLLLLLFSEKAEAPALRSAMDDRRNFIVALLYLTYSSWCYSSEIVTTSVMKF